MKCLKAIVAVVMCLLILAAFSPVRASAEGISESSDAQSMEASAELKEFAAKSALPFIKGWLKNSGKVGKYFQSSEEIDQLQVGSIIRVCFFKEETDLSKVTALSDAIYVSDYWMILFCTPEGEVKWYAMYHDKTDEGGGYQLAQEAGAVGIGQALDTFEKINKANSLNIDPTVIWYVPYETILMEVIDGKEYVITAGSTDPLDVSYTKVTDPQYLPTGTDALKALREVQARPSYDEKGNLLLGDMGLFWLTASEQPSVPQLPAWQIVLIAVGVCAVVAGAAYPVVKGKRKENMSNQR